MSVATPEKVREEVIEEAVEEELSLRERLERAAGDMTAFKEWFSSLDDDAYIDLYDSQRCLGARWYIHVAEREGLERVRANYAFSNGEVIYTQGGEWVSIPVKSGEVGTTIANIIYTYGEFPRFQSVRNIRATLEEVTA